MRRAKNTNKLLPRDFLRRIIKLHLAGVSVASCSSISSVNGPDRRIRLPRYYLPIQFCLIFLIPRLFLPSFSVISCLSLLCFCWPREISVLPRISHPKPSKISVYDSAVQNFYFVSRLIVKLNSYTYVLLIKGMSYARVSALT